MAYDPSTSTGDLVAWGDDPEPRPGRLTTISARLGIGEHQIIMGLAGTGAALAGLSLVTSWQVTTMPAGRPATTPAMIELSVAGIGSWGTAYLTGLPGLLAAGALALFGAPGARRYARLAGLGWAVGLLGVLLAAATSLGKPESVLGTLLVLSGAPDARAGHGPGPFLAIAGVALIGIALHLQDQAGGAAEAARGSGGVIGEPATLGHPNPGHPAPVVARPAAAPPPVPGVADLTVSETAPFVHLPEPRDRR